jgi:glycine cleavage system aminomethyltransferase T
MMTSAPSRLPLQRWHTSNGARFADSDGWQLPSVYTSVETETAAARTAVALADLSAFAKIRLLGRGADAAARQWIGDGPLPAPHGVALLQAPSAALVCRLTADHLLLLASTTAPPPLFPFEAPAVVATDVTCAYASYCLAGPRGEALLHQLTALDVAALPSSGCAETGLASVHAVVVRAPELCVPSVRILVAWDVAEYVWETLFDAGRVHGITPLGLDGWRSLQAVAPSPAG